MFLFVIFVNLHYENRNNHFLTYRFGCIDWLYYKGVKELGYERVETI